MNQSLAALARPQSSLSQAHSWHTQSRRGSFLTHCPHSRPGRRQSDFATSVSYALAAGAGSSREAPATLPCDRSSLNFSMSPSKNFGGNIP